MSSVFRLAASFVSPDDDGSDERRPREPSHARHDGPGFHLNLISRADVRITPKGGILTVR